MNRVKNFIGAMREKGVRTVKRAVPAFFTAYCYFSMYVPVYAAKAYILLPAAGISDSQ